MPVHDVITDAAKLADKMRAHGNCYLGQDRAYYIEYEDSCACPAASPSTSFRQTHRRSS